MTGVLTEKQARREAYLRRVWRLAYLLTTDLFQARRLFAAVLIERPQFAEMDIDILTRLVILRAREYETGLMRSPALQRALKQVQEGEGGEGGRQTEGSGEAALTDLPVPLALICAHALPRQAMETWLLKKVDGLGDIALSRATDCSRTASALHFDQAEKQMHDMLGDELEPLTEQLKTTLLNLDAAPAIQHWKRRTKRRRLLRLLVIVAFIVIGFIVARRVWG